MEVESTEFGGRAFQARPMQRVSLDSFDGYGELVIMVCTTGLHPVGKGSTPLLSIRSLGPVVRTPPCHGGGTGSIPVGTV